MNTLGNKRTLTEDAEDKPKTDNAQKDQPKKKPYKLTRADKDDAYDSLGMKKVKGNLGGTYYEETDVLTEAAMSRQVYVAIAKILKGHQCSKAESLADDFADYFAGDNSTFDRGRFMAACGFPD